MGELYCAAEEAVATAAVVVVGRDNRSAAKFLLPLGEMEVDFVLSALVAEMPGSQA